MMTTRKMLTKHHAGLLLMALLLLSMLSGYSVTAYASSTMDVKVNVTYGQTEARAMLDYINKFRAGNDVDGQKANYINSDNSTYTDLTGKLQPLTYDYNLEKVAMQRAAEIAMTFDHTRPDGTSCFTAWNGSGSWTGYGENIAAGYSTAYKTFVQWREDDEDYNGQGHRRNMLDARLTKIGIGHVVFNGMHFWTHAFGTGTGSTQETTADNSAREVTVSVKTSDIKNFSASASPASYEIKTGGTADLPTVSLTMGLPETWPSSTFNATTDATWTSDNTNVASVENGKVKGINSGTANLKATVNGTSLTVPVKVKGAEEHTHTLVKTEAKAATCTEAGNTAYWTCSGCKKYFSDANGKNEIEENSWVIKATGHSLTKTAAKEATETQAGNKEYWTCSKCGKYFSDANGTTEIAENSWIIPAKGHTHSLTKIEAKAATCTEAGNTAYWTCSGCKKYFSDAEGKNEITKDSWVIKATGHKLTKTEAKEATATEDGNDAYWTCSECGKYFSDAQGTTEIEENSWIIPATGDTPSDPDENLPWYKKLMKKRGYKYYKLLDINGDKIKELFLSNNKGPNFDGQTDKIEIWRLVNNKAVKLKTINDLGAISKIIYIKKYKTLVHMRHFSGTGELIMFKLKNGKLKKVKTIGIYQPYHDYKGTAKNKKYVYRINGKKVSKKKAVKLWKKYCKTNKSIKLS